MKKMMGHPMTDQDNDAPEASAKGDGVFPSAKGKSVTKGQAAPAGHFRKTEFKVTGTDGTPLKAASHGPGMSGGAGPKHGKSRLGKMSTATSEVSQAIRRRQKASSYP